MGMAKYDRLLYILNLLRSRRSLNAEALARECQVTERSIYRDIISLSEANVPIYYDRGYKLASESFLPALNFNFEEYSTLRLALESSPLGTTGRKAQVLKQIRAKVEASLSQPTRERKRTALDTTFIEIDTAVSNQQAARFFSIIEQAVSDQTSLEIDYETIEHGPTSRLVDPYFIIFRGRAFYFVAYCHLRKDLRTFRIDRIRSLRPTGRLFQRRREVSVHDYFADSWRLFSGEPVQVAVRFTGRAARIVAADRHHPNESVERRRDGSVVYRLKVAGTEEIRRWILGFGAEAEVLEPPELRVELAQIAGRLQSLYARRTKARN